MYMMRKPKKQLFKKKASVKKNFTLCMMALPATLVLFIFSYIPMFGLILAFKDFKYNKGFFGSDWIGLKNFEILYKTDKMGVLLTNTIGLNILFIIVGLVVSVSLALMMNEVTRKGAIKTIQTLIFIPYLLSWVAVGFLGYAFMQHDHGIFNTLLVNLGMEKIKWYAEPKYWPFILTFVSVWKSAGYNSLVYYAAIIGIDSSYYEAARIDGASRWRMVWNITLPMIRSVIVVMLILSLGGILGSDMGLFFQVTRDQSLLYPTTDVLNTFIYRTLITLGDTGISSATSFFQSVVGFVLVVVSNLIVRKIDEESALF